MTPSEDKTLADNLPVGNQLAVSRVANKADSRAANKVVNRADSKVAKISKRVANNRVVKAVNKAASKGRHKPGEPGSGLSSKRQRAAQQEAVVVEIKAGKAIQILARPVPNPKVEVEEEVVVVAA